MHQSIAPRHVEAYPRLDAAKALRQWRKGELGLLWRNRFGHVIGHGVVRWISPVEVELEYHVRDTGYIDRTHAIIRLPVRYIARPAARCGPIYPVNVARSTSVSFRTRMVCGLTIVVKRS